MVAKVLKPKRTIRLHKKQAYRVFISHSGEDVWVAEQLASQVESVGARTFLDVRDIAHGDKFKDRIGQEMPQCRELLALFTPWSRHRAWVRHEIGMADALHKRVVCVFYHVTNADFGPDEGGLGPIDGLNVIDINKFDTYLKALARRVSER